MFLLFLFEVMEMRYAIIVAGGSGSRMASEVPKQFLRIGGKPILLRTIERFIEFDPQIEIILVLPAGQIPAWEQLTFEFRISKHINVAEGGATRYDSVKAGLNEITGDGIVGVHDGVRPFVSIECLRDCYHQAKIYGSAIPVTTIEETLRLVEGESSKWVNRGSYRSVQTPQCFRSEDMKQAYAGDYLPEYTDDASVMEKAGHHIHLVSGNKENIKITTPEDMALAQYLCSLS